MTRTISGGIGQESTAQIDLDFPIPSAINSVRIMVNPNGDITEIDDDNNNYTVSISEIPPVTQISSISADSFYLSLGSLLFSVISVGLLAMLQRNRELKREQAKSVVAHNGQPLRPQDAVSPVIATILLVAITVVVVGVLYVWVSALARGPR